MEELYKDLLKMDTRTAAAAVMVVCSEMGDKTFFITALMAMKHSRSSVIAGAFSANTVMTVLSALMGSIASVFNKGYTHYLSIVLLLIFGFRMIAEGYAMDEAEEKSAIKDAEVETSESRPSLAKWAGKSPLTQTFLLTFVGEWGDRSQVTTIAMAANEGIARAVLGAILGHAVCVCVAVYGAQLVAQRVSLRSVTLLGGFVFLLFAFSNVVLGPGI